MQVILDLDLDYLSLDLQTYIQQYILLQKLSLLHVRFIHCETKLFIKGTYKSRIALPPLEGAVSVVTGSILFRVGKSVSEGSLLFY